MKWKSFLLNIFIFTVLLSLIIISCTSSGGTPPDDIEPPENGTPSPAPEIEVWHDSTSISSGGNCDFGGFCIITSNEMTFTIVNMGTENLNLTGIPDMVVVSGEDASLFTITSQPASPISPNGSSFFSVRFSTMSSGEKTVTLTIENDDPNDNPYTFTITATGIVPPAKIPATGQTTSYATGDDGDLEKGVIWPSPRFIEDEDGIITDRLIGLMWRKDGGTGNRSWSSAVNYANNLTFGGYTDWRLPNVNEYQSLINAEERYPYSWLNNQGFDYVRSNDYWSSTTSGADPYIWAWILHFDGGGYLARTNKPTPRYAWAVRDGQSGVVSLPKTGQTYYYSAGDDGDLKKGVSWPSPRFVDNANGIITDNLTGLMWEKAPTATTQTWVDAITYANGLILDGYSDWRLPNKNELRSLINYGSGDNASWLNWQGFDNVQAGTYWSSTTFAPDTGSAWVVGTMGHVVYYDKNSKYYVWAVRDGTYLSPSPSSGSIINDTTPLIDWEDIGGAISYHIQVNTDPGFEGDVIVDDSGLLTSEYSVTNVLTHNTTYYWRVKYKNGKGLWSDWSDTWNFAVVIIPPGNLILNPSCDDTLVGGEIPYWTEVVSTSWTQRSSYPNPYDGTAYFSAGNTANAELSQTVDVSALAIAIDSGTLRFAFEGYVRSYNSIPTDSSRIVLEYLDTSQTIILDSFDTGEIKNRNAWQRVSRYRTAPVNTRWIRIRLISTRYSVTMNGGYYDALSLYAN